MIFLLQNFECPFPPSRAVLPAILTCAGQDPQGSPQPTPKRRTHRPSLGLDGE